jgi:tRNA pseudouridine55 synthase
MAGVTVAAARQVAADQLTGALLQVPPMVSALKVGGRRLHELAREGVEVEREPRPVVVHRFTVDPGAAPGVLAVEVVCSSGTYVRSLAADLGRLLGGGAHLRNLRRTAIGPYTVAAAHPLDEVHTDCLLAPVDALAHLPLVTVDAGAVPLVAQGRVLERSHAFSGDGPWRVAGPDGALLAVYEPFGEGVKPAVVVASG